MVFKNLIYEVKEGILFLTINRQEVLNSLDPETVDELYDAFLKAKDDPEIKAVILTGAGDKSFVSGADIKSLSTLKPIQGKEFAIRGQKTFSLIENLGKPVIAAVNGFALGGGCELAMACNIRLASENAKFGQPEVNLGIIPGYGGTQRLPRLVGRGIAMELILSGNIIRAEEAFRIGLVNHVYPREELMGQAVKLAKTIMSKGPVAIKLAMEAVNMGIEMNLEEGMIFEANLFGLTVTTEDMIEGTTAFLEKRKAEFKGR
jgi:enoyl-CoA hydratase